MRNFVTRPHISPANPSRVGPTVIPDPSAALIARAELLEANAARSLLAAEAIVAALPALAAQDAEASLPPDALISTRDWLRLRRADSRRPCERVTPHMLTHRLWYLYPNLRLVERIPYDEPTRLRKFVVADLRFACDWLIEFSEPDHYPGGFRKEWREKRKAETERILAEGGGYLRLRSARPRLSVRRALATVPDRPVS
jgi:hypothetical protein